MSTPDGVRANLHLDEHAVSLPIAQSFADEQLIMAHAIEITGVQKRDPGIQSRVDCRDALRLIRRTVEIRHPQTAKPDPRYDRTVRAQFVAIHHRAPIVDRWPDRRMLLAFLHE